MTDILAEAIRAGVHAHGVSGSVAVGIKAALKSAYPRDPSAAVIEAMAVAICCGDNCDAANACSGHDLSTEGYAEKYGCLSKERQNEAAAAYREHPLWIALYATSPSEPI